MLFIQYLPFLLLILICELTSNTNQNDLSLSTNNYKQRIKRFLFGKSSKTKSYSEAQLESDQPEDILLNNELSVLNNDENRSQKEPSKGLTQQELAEIKRILSKQEDDYYGILNIRTHATPDQIVSAYRKLTLRVHPDKFNAPGATEATQRLNKARAELLKKFQNQNNNQKTAKMFTTRSSTFNENKNREIVEIINKSDFIPTFSPSPSAKEKSKTSSFDNTYKYLLVPFIILMMGIIIFIVYCKNRQRHSSSSTNANNSKKKKKFAISSSPEFDDDNVTNVNRDSEASVFQDEE